MKMRKLFAGIAAAATLLGGMALSAASAQADGSGTVVTSKVNFTFTAQDAKQLTNRKLDAYKIADYVQYGTGSNATYGVQTAGTVTDNSGIKAALEAAVAGTNKTVPTDGGDLMAWALAEGVLSVDNSADGAWNNSASRKFVESLKTTTDKLGTAEEVDLGAAANGTSATVTLPAGLYLFVDADYSVGTNGAATPSIASSLAPVTLGWRAESAHVRQLWPLRTQTTAVTKNGEWRGTSITRVPVGPRNVTSPITSKVPQNTQYYSDYGYTYTDTPSAGQTVDFDSLKVTVGDKSLNKGTDYTVAQNKNGTFTVTISSIQKQTAGALITVTYAAKVTEAGASGSKAVTNAVVLSDNGAEATDSTTITNSGFSFTKTDAQGNPLADATFTIRVPGVDGSFTATSDKTGTVTFKGLADGTYEVNETTVPNGFQQSLKAKFNVIIENGEVKFRGTDVWGLAPKESSDKYQVKNVKNVTQLPLTGAAGTTLFTVVALLVAGAGVTVALKSRQRVH